MKRATRMCTIVAVFLIATTVMAVIRYVRTPPTPHGLTTVQVEGFTAQNEDTDSIFKTFSFVPITDDPQVIESLVFQAARKEIFERQQQRSLLSEPDLRDACRVLACAITSDAGRSRQDMEKDLAYAKPLPIPVSLGEKLDKLTPAEQFKECFDRKLIENPRLVGVCLNAPTQCVMFVDQCEVSADLARGFAQVKSPPGFYLTETICSPAYVFHHDPDYKQIVDMPIQVRSLSCSIPVKDQEGNMYPLNLTVYKSPINGRWWLHRAWRTVNMKVQDFWPIIF